MNPEEKVEQPAIAPEEATEPETTDTPDTPVEANPAETVAPTEVTPESEKVIPEEPVSDPVPENPETVEDAQPATTDEEIPEGILTTRNRPAVMTQGIV